MALNFEKFVQEGNEFMNDLAFYLGYTNNKNMAALLFKATMHVLRDRISISESFHVLSQLPMVLKALYVENWKYQPHPLPLHTIDEFNQAVYDKLATYGVRDFDWDISPEVVAKTINFTLQRYLSQGEIDHIVSQLPSEWKQLFDLHVQEGGASQAAGQ